MVYLLVCPARQARSGHRFIVSALFLSDVGPIEIRRGKRSWSRRRSWYTHIRVVGLSRVIHLAHGNLTCRSHRHPVAPTSGFRGRPRSPLWILTPRKLFSQTVHWRKWNFHTQEIMRMLAARPSRHSLELLYANFSKIYIRCRQDPKTTNFARRLFNNMFT